MRLFNIFMLLGIITEEDGANFSKEIREFLKF